MTKPKPQAEQLPPDENSGTPGSTAYMALVGAIAGGMPQLFLPTSTIVELIGNTIMGAVLVAIVDAILIRKTLPEQLLRRGRLLLIFFVSITLSIVTYRTARGVFQNTFGSAPPPEVESLTASVYTRERIGHVGYRLLFVVDPLGLKKITDEMETLPGAEFEAFSPATAAATSATSPAATQASTRNAGPRGETWQAFVDRVDAGDTSLPESVKAFPNPQGFVWSTRAPSDRQALPGPPRVAKTVLLRDKDTGRTYVHHIAG